MPHEAAVNEIMTALVVVKTLILVLGGVITYFAFKAYFRTRDRSLGLLASGFATITLGALLGGMVFELLRVSLATGIVIEGIFVLVGFTLIAISLRT